MTTPDVPDPSPSDAGSDPAGQRSLDESIRAIERPDRRLLHYYLLRSLVFGPALLFALPFFFFRYRTLRYRFDGEGVSMAWGVLFRREVDLTYSRIQDIHLSSNVVERWLGLARIEIQTASGSAKAEMVIEGVPEYEALRDFLYSRMRGVSSGASAQPAAGSEAAAQSDGDDELASALRDVAGELRALRHDLERSRGAAPSSSLPSGSADVD